MAQDPSNASNSKNVPPQRKTTLKWSENGELSAIDMVRVLKKLNNSNLIECDVPRVKDTNDPQS